MLICHAHSPTAVLPCTVGSVPELRPNSSDLIEMMEVRCRKINRTVQLKRKYGSIMTNSVEIIYIYKRNKLLITSMIFLWPSKQEIQRARATSLLCY